MTLTPMQSKVADCLGRGLSYAKAADELHIAPGTVKAHANAIAGKLTSQNPHKLPPQALIRLTFGKAA